MGVTNKLYAACATHLSQGTTPAAADAPAWIHLETSSTMTAAYTVATNAIITACTSAGLVPANATLSLSTNAVANDTCRSTYTFTCGATTGVIWGHTCCSASTAYNMLSYYDYAGVQNLASGDTLACTIDHQFVIGS